MTLTTTPAEIVRRAEASGRPGGLLGRHPSWHRKPVGDLVKIVNGAPFPSRAFNQTGRGLPLIRIRDVGVNNPKTYFDGPYDESMLVQPGDLLVGMDGDFRLARWRGPVALLNQRVCRLVPVADEVDERWLLHSLQGYLDAIWSETSSVTVKHLSSKSIAAIPLPLPPLEEQRRIVDFLENHLSRMDRGWEYGLSAQRRLATLRAGLFGQAVGESHACLLGEVARVKSGFAFPSACWRSEGTPVIKIANVRNGRVDVSGCSFVDSRTAATSADFLVTRGDLLITLTGEIGAIGVYSSDTEARLNQRVGRIDVHRPDLLDRSFLRYALESSRCRVAMWAAAKGMAQPNISPREVEKLVMPLPSLEQQRVIVGNLEGWASRLDASDRLLASAFRRSEQLRRAILHAAFSGQLLSDAIPKGRYV